jgi:hypothetical protein
MGYNPGVRYLDPLEAASVLESRRQFDLGQPGRERQGRTYEKQVDLQGKDFEAQQKEKLRALKQENDRQRALAVAYGMPKEEAEARSIGELMGFTGKKAEEEAIAARQWRDEDARAQSQALAAESRKRVEEMGLVGQVVKDEKTGVMTVRTGPGQAQVVKMPATKGLETTPSASLMRMREDLFLNATKTGRLSYESLPTTRRAMVDAIDLVLEDRGTPVKDEDGEKAMPGNNAGPQLQGGAGKVKFEGPGAKWRVR